MRSLSRLLSALRKPGPLAASAWLLAALLGAAFAPLVAPEGPIVADTDRLLLPPGPGGLLGTDWLGRDLFGRLLWGGHWTLATAGVALLTAVGLGLPVGLAAGTLGGRVEALLTRLVEATLAFPALLLAMAVLAILGPGMGSVSLAVGLAAAPAYASVARAAAADVRARPYVEAAESLGGGRWHILRRHILPNAAGPLLAFGASQLGWVLLNGAALHFLGLGAPLGTPDWGAMIAEGRLYLEDAPWVGAFPGLALTTTVLAANLLADKVREALTPR
ncbi:MAG: ABC transporter permease [Anaerolineales bacterium]|nr:MAG: ABC transporter permease [Anaerolineales bacterium]